MSKGFHVPVEVKTKASLYVTADSKEAAYEKADSIMYWAYQNGDPLQHALISVQSCEIEVDGEEVNLDEYRDTEE